MKFITKIIKKMQMTKKLALIAPLLAGVGSGLFTSCNDFLTIYPTDRIVGEDFWKTKADVEQMVDGAYKSMIDYNVLERAIIWGAYRSDELVKRSDLSAQHLDNIDAVNLQPTLGYCSWASYYHVINNCNIILNHAPGVMAEDPEFTQGDYDNVRAQMLTLRALCYFYLVRAFRDVPYMTQAIENDSQIEEVAQSTPGEILQRCISDVERSVPYLMMNGAYGRNDWRNWGYITRDAAHALLADLYLWRGSMTKSASDFQQVVNYAEKVITAKDTYYRQNNTTSIVGSDNDDRYHLNPQYYYFLIFTNGNEHESILEWQYNGRNNSNTCVRDYYYNHDEKENKSSILMASPIFNSPDENADTDKGKKIYLSKNDYRMWNNVYDAGESETTQLGVRKMVSTGINSSTEKTTKSYVRGFTEFQQNWIVYRLTDVMLMEAEALVALSTSDSDPRLTTAFELVNTVNKRAMDTSATDLLDITKYDTKDKMELLVLNERERELCFEGKRWFDLLRYTYRHMEGVDIHKLMADQGTSVKIDGKILTLNFLTRKYGDGGLGASVYKMNSEPWFYWPIQESEIKVNGLLRQNPVWIQERSTSKN